MDTFQKAQGAFSMLSSTISSAATNYGAGGGDNSAKPKQSVVAAAVEKSPDDIPKEELMALCMKMNKRMQVLEAKAGELSKRKTTLLEDRRLLMDMVCGTMGVSIAVGDDEDVRSSVIAGSWDEWSRSNRQKLRLLELRLADLEQQKSGQTADQANVVGEAAAVDPVHSAALLEKCTRLEVDLEESKRKEEFARNQMIVLEADIRSKVESLESLRRELEASNAKREEAVLYLQLQLNKAREAEEQREKELVGIKKQLSQNTMQISHLQLQCEEKENSLRSHKEMLVALQSRLEEGESNCERLKERNKELERNIGAASVMKAEHESIVANLRKDLKSALEFREQSERYKRESDTLSQKLDAANNRVSALAEQVSALQASEDEKSSLITRMRSEQINSERNHAMRTAMLATCEAQVESLKQEIAVKDATAKEAVDRVSVLQVRLAGAESRLEERVNEFNAEIHSLQQQMQQLREQHEIDLKAAVDAHESALEVVKKENAKKSSAARALLVEREEENRVLADRVKELTAEIQSGAPSERRIFELAQMQAKRDAAYGTHSDTRETAFMKLQSTLAAKDLQLAELQQMQSTLMAEVGELRRTSRREGCNMDYLKNVVLQYMTFPINSTERASLVPVIAMLLQFNAKELAEVDKSQRVPLFGARPVKEVKRSLSKAAELHG